MRVVESERTIMDGAEAICFRCRGGVVIGFTDRGAMLPLDLGPAETGALAVSMPGPGKAPRVRYLRGDDPELAAGEQRMAAHWTTHPACKGERKARRRAATRAACKPRTAQPSPVPAPRDLTLDQLATVDLEVFLARLGARPPIRGFSSAI